MIHSPAPRLNYNLLLRLYENLISFIHPLSAWILIFCFVFMNIWYHSFTRSHIKFWSSASFLWTLDFILSSAPRLNFDLLFRLYEHLISLFHPIPDWILIFCFVFTNNWFHSFTRSLIELWFSTSSLRTLDFIRSSALRLNFDLPLRLYEHLLSFIHQLPYWIMIFFFVFYEHLITFINPLPDWILIFYFVITNT